MLKKIFFLLSIFSFSQNITDANGLKQGKWDLFYPNTDIISETGIFLDDKEDGLWVKYHDDGIIREIANYTLGKLDGVKILLDKKGKLIQQENYINGEYNGSQLYFHETGKMKLKF